MSDANLALEDYQICFRSLASAIMIVLPSTFCLPVVLESANVNTSYCAWITALGQVERSKQKQLSGLLR